MIWALLATASTTTGFNWSAIASVGGLAALIIGGFAYYRAQKYSGALKVAESENDMLANGRQMFKDALERAEKERDEARKERDQLRVDAKTRESMLIEALRELGGHPPV